ncbi:MAG: hypothetical protein Q7S00_05360 [bacterium]|nr:hypothetical protein [bacterium]
MMTRRLLFISILFSLPLLAYGPNLVNTSDHEPVKWQAMPVTYHLATNTTIHGLDVSSYFRNALSAWEGADGSDILFDGQTLQDSNGNDVVDVTTDDEDDPTYVCNLLYEPGACPNGPDDDGQNPVVFDADGSIIGELSGGGNVYTTLGLAGIVSYNNSSHTALKAIGFFNAACVGDTRDAGCGSLAYTTDDLEGFILHEMGHFLGFNHTQVNLDEATDGDGSNNQYIPTMYAFFISGNGANMKTLNRDDEIAAANLYPSSSFASGHCQLSGTVYDQDGKEMQCANVIARNTDSAKSKTDAISFVSGNLSAIGTFDGDFIIKGLEPGETYQLEVEQNRPLLASELLGSGIRPCTSRPTGYPSSESEPFPPTFTKKTFSQTYTCTTGGQLISSSITLSLDDVNVNPGSGSSTSGLTSSSSSSGCSLIR